MKAILLSVKPEHALNILEGRKTLELRKSVPKGFVGWVYVYITKTKPYLEPRECNGEFVWNIHSDFIYHTDLNSKIPFRFWFDEYEEVLTQHHIDSEQIERILKQACIEHDDLDKYVGDKETIYAWHVKKLEVFDKPMELQELNILGKGRLEGEYIPLHHAPQSYQYVWVQE